MFSQTTRILVVDDMPSISKIISKRLMEMGFTNISVAREGQSAWDLLRQSTEAPFGLILSDWNMPNGTGIDFVKRVRFDWRFKEIPFLMITAEACQAAVEEARQAGVTTYLCKPFNAEMLRIKIEETYHASLAVKESATRR